MRNKCLRIVAIAMCMSLLMASTGMAKAKEASKSPFTNSNVTAPGTLPIAVKKETISIATSQAANVVDYDTNYLVNWIEKRNNVDIVWELFPATDAVAKFDLMVASRSKLPDITTVGLNAMTVLKYGTAGVIIPLNHYYENGAAAFLEKRMKEVGQPNFLNYLTSADGNIYVLGKNNISAGNIAAVRAYVNVDWLKALKLEDPKNIDEFVDMLRAFRDKDPNGNGRKDEIPMIGAVGGWETNPFNLILNFFSYYDGTGNYWDLKDGTLDVVYDNDEYREALRFAKKLVDEKLLSELSFTQDNSSYTAIAAGTPQVIGVGVSGSRGGYATNQNSYEYLKVFDGPNGHKATTLIPQVPVPVAAITSSCKNPDLAFRMMESTYGDTLFETMQYLGEPDVDWKDLTPEERKKYDIGLPLNQFVLRINEIHGTMQNKNLVQSVFCTLTTSGGIPQFITAGADGKVDLELTERTRRQNSRLEYNKSFFPKEYVEMVNYSVEENEQWSELRSVIKSYVDECQARFIMGDMNIERDWAAYLDQLKSMGYMDLLKADQIAYNRTVGK